MEENNSLLQPIQLKEIRKRNMLNISEKIQLIKLMENSRRKKKDIAAEFGIPVSTVGSIYANRERYLEKSKGDFTNLKLKRLRPSTYPDIEQGLLDWYIKNHNNGYISCLTLRTKALEVAKSLGHVSFTASNGWIERFKSRHNLKFKRYKEKNSSRAANSSSSDAYRFADVSLGGNSSEADNSSQFTAPQNQVWENVSDQMNSQPMAVVKTEYDDSYNYQCDSLNSYQNGTERVRGSSPSPSHWIPEVHLTESFSDNQTSTLSNSLNFDLEMSHSDVTIQNVENAYSVILNYVANCDEKVTEKTYDALRELKTFITSERKKKSQSKITDYFSSL